MDVRKVIYFPYDTELSWIALDTALEKRKDVLKKYKVKNVRAYNGNYWYIVLPKENSKTFEREWKRIVKQYYDMLLHKKKLVVKLPHSLSRGYEYKKIIKELKRYLKPIGENKFGKYWDKYIVVTYSYSNDAITIYYPSCVNKQQLIDVVNKIFAKFKRRRIIHHPHHSHHSTHSHHFVHLQHSHIAHHNIHKHSNVKHQIHKNNSVVAKNKSHHNYGNNKLVKDMNKNRNNLLTNKKLLAALGATIVGLYLLNREG